MKKEELILKWQKEIEHYTEEMKTVLPNMHIFYKTKKNTISSCLKELKNLNGETVKLVKDCRIPSDTACPKAYSSIKCVECPHLK